MTSAAAPSLSELSHLYTVARPSLERVLHRYRIPPKDACGLIETAALELIYKGGDAEDPAAWLVSRLRSGCREYWVARRHRLIAAVDQVFPA